MLLEALGFDKNQEVIAKILEELKNAKFIRIK